MHNSYFCDWFRTDCESCALVVTLPISDSLLVSISSWGLSLCLCPICVELAGFLFPWKPNRNCIMATAKPNCTPALLKATGTMFISVTSFSGKCMHASLGRLQQKAGWAATEIVQWDCCCLNTEHWGQNTLSLRDSNGATHGTPECSFTFWAAISIYMPFYSYITLDSANTSFLLHKYAT